MVYHVIVLPSDRMEGLEAGLEALVNVRMPGLRVSCDPSSETGLPVIVLFAHRTLSDVLLGREGRRVASLTPCYDEDGNETGGIVIRNEGGYVGISYDDLACAAANAGYEVEHRVELEQ